MGLYPGAQTRCRGQRLKLLATEPLVQRLREQLSAEGRSLADLWGGPQDREPGTLLALAEGVGVVVATGGCPVLIRKAQLEGKGAVEGTALLQQLNLRVGDSLAA
jgi:methionyl-tRNA formyltransferase